MADWYQWINVEYVKRLVKRFLLRDTPADPEAFILIKAIQPITDADELLRETKLQYANVDLTGAAGTAVTFLTIPKNKRWRLRYFIRFATTGSGDIGVTINGDAVALIAPDTSKLFLEPNTPLALEEDDKLIAFATGNAGDGAITCYAIYDEESAF